MVKRPSSSGLAAVARASIRVHSLTPTNPHRTQNRIIGLIEAIILYIPLMIYGNLIAQGVIEEKASRIVEILLATIRPGQLLLGKLIGIGLVGLLQLAIIGAAGLILIAKTHVVAVPAFGAGVIAGGLLWFVLGFVLYAILYGAAGSLVSRQEDAAMVTLLNNPRLKVSTRTSGESITVMTGVLRTASARVISYC